MGKKFDSYSGFDIYDQKRNDLIADHLEAYLDGTDNLFILEGKSEPELKKSRKVIRKAIKDLREGHPEKVYNIERCCEYYGDLEFDD